MLNRDTHLQIISFSLKSSGVNWKKRPPGEDIVVFTTVVLLIQHPHPATTLQSAAEPERRGTVGVGARLEICCEAHAVNEAA